MRHTAFYLILTAILFVNAYSDETDERIIGSAYLDNCSYKFLQKLCDEAGGRLPGSENNIKALNILKSELKSLGLNPISEEFKMPGWFRAKDEVEMLEPVKRKFRALALGFVDKTPEFVSDVVYAKNGLEDDYQGIDAKGKVVLVTQEAPKSGEAPLRYESIDVASRHGAKAILFINDKNGYLVMDGVTNFHGNPSPIPAYTITLEEGQWLRRLCQNNIIPKVRIVTESYCKPITSENVIVKFPGKVNKKIVIGAHFDSWDIGQGAVDNGHGTAILYDMCRLIKKFLPDNYYTIECVWLNAEETGLWGARLYNQMHVNDDIACMLNMDMTGSPTGMNVMGFDEFIPFFKDFAESLKGYNFSSDIASSPWTNSDHMYFMFEGIPSFTPQAYLDKDMYHYYHDAGDSFDKINQNYLSDGAAIMTMLVRHLANAEKLEFRKRSKQEVKDLLIKHNLDKRLKRQGEWKFD